MHFQASEGESVQLQQDGSTDNLLSPPPNQSYSSEDDTPIFSSVIGGLDERTELTVTQSTGDLAVLSHLNTSSSPGKYIDTIFCKV